MSVKLQTLMSFNPIHYWPLDEATGTIGAGKDYGSSALTLTYSVFVLNQIGVYDNSKERCPSTGGVNSYAVTTPVEACPTNFTIGGFAYRTSGTNQVMMSFATSGNPLRIGIDTAGASTFRAFIGDAAGNPWMSKTHSSTITNSTWYFVAISYDGTTLSINVDGTVSTSTATSGSRDTSSSLWWMGQYNSTFGSNWIGKLAHMFVFNTCLTTAQLKTIRQEAIRIGNIGG